MDTKENIEIGGSPSGVIQNHAGPSNCTSAGEKAARPLKLCTKCKEIFIYSSGPWCKECRIKWAEERINCTKCRKTKEKSSGPWCKKCRRQYAIDNKEEIAKKLKKYRTDNQQKFKEQNKKYRSKEGYNEKRREGNRKYLKERRKRDLPFNLLLNLRVRVSAFISGTVKSKKTKELLGCTMEELIVHLEKQFRDGMAWDNYGKFWSVDHKLPCASFDLTDHKQQQECFHYTNLQPLTVAENSSKGAKIGPEYKNQKAA